MRALKRLRTELQTRQGIEARGHISALPLPTKEQLLALLTAVGLVMSLMVIYADPAQAHHPTTTANQACVNGNVVLNYTSTSWRTDGGSGSGHGDVRVQISVEGGNWVEIGTGAYTATNGYSFSGQIDGSAYWGKSVQIRSQVVGPWDNGGGEGNSHSDTTTPAFLVSQDCFNPSCPDQYEEFKLEPVSAGTHGPNDAFTVTIHNTASGQTFDWTSTVPVYQVIVKGGPAANVYNYSPSQSGNGLHAPVNPSNSKYYGLSHISFCYLETAPTTTTTAPTTTTTAPTTTTTAPTTTTTAPTTTTTAPTTTTTAPTTTTTAPTTSTTVESTTTTVEATTTTVEATTTTVEATTTTVEISGSTVTTAPSTTSSTQPTTSSSIEDEVLSEEILPFTGVESEGLIIIASALAILGSLLVMTTRRTEEN